jgi:hypothetical protein
MGRGGSRTTRGAVSRGLPPVADGQDSPAAPLGEEAGDDEDDGPGGERGRSAMPSGTPVRTTLAATTSRPRACQVAACCRSSRSWGVEGVEAAADAGVELVDGASPVLPLDAEGLLVGGNALLELKELLVKPGGRTSTGSSVG